jgi:CubicO group peptidase (beta-lactamase class C family)
VFRIASMTKSFTALAILALRDEGKLSLDEPAGKYLFPSWRRCAADARCARPSPSGTC